MSTSRESCPIEFDRRDRIPLETGSMSIITIVLFSILDWNSIQTELFTKSAMNPEIKHIILLRVTAVVFVVKCYFLNRKLWRR